MRIRTSLAYALAQRLAEPEPGVPVPSVVPAILRFSRILATRDAFAYDDVPDAVTRLRFALSGVRTPWF